MIKQDDIIEITISGLGMDGEGVGRTDGHTIFIPFALMGELVRAKITYVKKNIAKANLLTVIKPSNARIKPVCNRFERCGGCDLLHMDYGAQLALKKDNIKNLFQKNMKTDIEIPDVIESPQKLCYRNKIQVPFGTVNGKTAVGFFREGSHKIVSITKCFLHGDWAEKLIAVFLEYSEKFNISAYDENTKTGVLRHLTARKIDDTLFITVVTNNANLPNIEFLIARLKATLAEDFCLYLSKKLTHNNIVMGEKTVCLKEGKRKINILGIDVELNPYSFLQLNDEVRDLIYNRIISEILRNKPDTVIDAYAGAGLLGAVLAKNGMKVYNIEIVKEATDDAEKIRINNKIDGIKNINGDAAIMLSQIIKESGDNITIILDPPRKGCDAAVLDAINGIDKPFTLYYISCNPATLTRDLALLRNVKIDFIQPYDMFPQTKHVETLVKLSGFGNA